MEEFQLRPSDQVWTDVEAMIRKEKKRRRVILFWWLLPALLTAGGLGYYFLAPKNLPSYAAQPQPGQRVQAPSTTSTAPATSRPAESLVPPLEHDGDHTSKSVTIHPDLKTQALPAEKYEFLAAPGDDLADRKFKIALHKSKEKNHTRREAALPDADIESTASPVKKELPVFSQQDPAFPPLTAEISNPIAGGKDDALKEQKIPTPVIEPGPDELSTKKEADAVKITKRKWQWGLALAPGLSNTRRGKLFSMEEKALADASGSIGNGNFVQGPVAAPGSPSVPEAGLSAGMEFFGTKSIGRRLDVRAGILYQYHSSRLEVGEKVVANRTVTNEYSSGANISSYYRAASTVGEKEDYRNRYHLLGLSGSLSWKIIRSKTFSISWENGLSVSRLLATNALLYDRNSSGYYQDAGAFRKTQVFFHSGISLPLWNKNGGSLSLHPSAGFSLTPVYRAGNGKNAHYIHYGIGIRYLFPGR